ncbi:uncharacterized protein LOC127750424, partial [Frankliniella occidentalis]|uniref:Uncharacterized protein LOC127750424 n=1 Tax=Frankliniella occidentalis TaxID=133901 RepID=A0A9C6XR51_FRAOC
MYIPTDPCGGSGADLRYHQLLTMLKPQPTEPNIQAVVARAGPTSTPAAAPQAKANKDINIDVISAKCYDAKMPPTLAPPLLIDADNYMLRDVRPRSLSHGALQRPPRTPHGSPAPQQQDGPAGPQHGHLDLDMFCVRETVNSLAAAVRKLNLPSSRGSSPVSTSSENVSSKSNCSEESVSSCARTLSLHGMLCTCRLTCCCLCSSLCSPDCHACLH